MILAALAPLLVLVFALVSHDEPPKRSEQTIAKLYRADGVQCTAFSIHEAHQLWVTTRHCVVQNPDATSLIPYADSITIGGQPAGIVFLVSDEDLAVLFRAGLPTRALELQAEPPAVGDQVHSMGYPMDAPLLTTFWGHVSTLNIRLGDGLICTLYDLRALPGDSGAPIFTTRSQVVGVVMWTNYGVTGGVPWSALVKLKDLHAWESS